MGLDFYLTNLDDCVGTNHRAKLCELITYIGDIALDYMRTWQNPFPNLTNPLGKIQTQRHATGPPKQASQDSRLISLPPELFAGILSQITSYRDVLNLASTCMELLERLVPITADLRRNFDIAVGEPRHPAKSWSGKRIVLLGEYETYGSAWPAFKDHIRKQIFAAAQRRGRSTLEPEIETAMAAIAGIKSPGEVAGFDDGDPEDFWLDHQTYQPGHEDCKIRGAKFKPLLDGSAFDIVSRNLVQLPIRVELNKLRHAESAEARRGRLIPYKEEKGMESLARELYAFELLSGPGAMHTQSQRRTYRNGLNERWAEHSQDHSRTYRIVNLDTLEHMDSEVADKHMKGIFRDDEDLTAAYVLTCHITYNGGGDGSINSELRGHGLFEGRWAGHRLYYEGSGCASLHLVTTDISLEMVEYAKEVLMNDDIRIP